MTEVVLKSFGATNFAANHPFGGVVIELGPHNYIEISYLGGWQSSYVEKFNREFWPWQQKNFALLWPGEERETIFDVSRCFWLESMVAMLSEGVLFFFVEHITEETTDFQLGDTCNCIVYPHRTCNFKSSICSKWLEMLIQQSPDPLTTRVQQKHIAFNSFKYGWTLPTPFWNTISDETWWLAVFWMIFIDAQDPQIYPHFAGNLAQKTGIVGKITQIQVSGENLTFTWNILHRVWGSSKSSYGAIQARTLRQEKKIQDKARRSLTVAAHYFVENTTWIELVQVGTTC